MMTTVEAVVAAMVVAAMASAAAIMAVSGIDNNGFNIDFMTIWYWEVYCINAKAFGIGIGFLNSI